MSYISENSASNRLRPIVTIKSDTVYGGGNGTVAYPYSIVG